MGEVELGNGKIHGDKRRLNFGDEHTKQYSDDVL